MSTSVMAAASAQPFLAFICRSQWAFPPPRTALPPQLTICAVEKAASATLSSAFRLRSARAGATAPPAEPLDRPEAAVNESMGKDCELKGMENASLSHRDSRNEQRRFSGLKLLQRLKRKVLRELSSFSLAIGELFTIAALSALGTIIEQGESTEFYMQSYPEKNPLFGFFTWRWVLGLNLDHIYTSPYFLGLLALLAASLMACTSTRQLPMVKVARRWSFLKFSSQILCMDVSDTLQSARLTDFGTLLMASGYEVFARGQTMYAFKGIAGKLAPIGVHAALLLVMGGATISATGSFRGSVMIPQGLQFNIGSALVASGFLSLPSPTMNFNVNVNRFFIDYRPNGEVAQFHSDLSLLDSNNNEVLQQTISVNMPLRFQGVTIYQTDWGISAIQIRVDGSDPFNLAMAALQKGDVKLFGTFLPLGDEGNTADKGISILARDLQSVAIYDKEGTFVGIRRPESNRPIAVNGVNILLEDIIGSTGLELKIDPGVPIVYAGFGALMLTTCISFLSHSQVWGLQEGTSIVVGGKSNRDKLMFERELNDLLDSVPEVLVKAPNGSLHKNDSNAGIERPLKSAHDSRSKTPLTPPSPKR